MAWLGGRTNSEKKKQQKGSGVALAVGTAAGDVKVFDAQLGELRWRRANVIEGGVTAVACSSSDDSLIYATGASKQVVALDAATGEVRSTFEVSKHAVSCLALSPDHASVFLGGSSLALWNLKAEERRAKYTGHPTPAFVATFSPDGHHVVSACAGERHAAVWSIDNGKKKKKTQPAAASLSLEDPPVQIDVCSPWGREENGAFHVAAVSQAGDVYLWACSGGGEEKEAEGEKLQVRLLARVRVGGTSGKKKAGGGETIMAVKVDPGQTGPILLVARGNSAVPVFQIVTVEDDSALTAPRVITLEPAVGGSLLPNGSPFMSKKGEAGAGSERAAYTRNDVTVLGPESLVSLVPGAAARAEASGLRKRADPEPEVAGSAQAEEEEEVADDGEEEATLWERVASLEERVASAERVPQGGEEDAQQPGTSGAGAALPKGSSRTDSLAVLLTQALRSNDRALLEKCLAAGGSDRLVTNTVRRLLPADSTLFLKAAVDRVLSKPARAAQLAPWIRALVHHHTGYMMTAPGAQAPLAALYQAIDGRVGLYHQLLKVYGRLSLITAHTVATRQGAAGGEEGEEEDGGGSFLPEPEVVLEDDEEEPQAEDPFDPLEDDESEDDEDDEDDKGQEGQEEEEGDDDDDPMSEDDDDDDGDDDDDE